jgi:predicted nucleic acid-binding protein
LVVYVESNFVLELTLQQEQAEAADAILGLAEAGRCALVLPEFALTEPLSTLRVYGSRRNELSDQLARQLRELARSETYRADLERYETLPILLANAQDEQLNRWSSVVERLLASSRTLPLDSEAHSRAKESEFDFGLSTTDALIFALILNDLDAAADRQDSCFLSRDRKDFSERRVVQELATRRCRFIPSFVDGLAYVENHLD